MCAEGGGMTQEERGCVCVLRESERGREKGGNNKVPDRIRSLEQGVA